MPKQKFFNRKNLIAITGVFVLGTIGFAALYLAGLRSSNEASQANPLETALATNLNSVSATAIVGSELGTVTVSNMPTVSTCNIEIGESISAFSGATYDSGAGTCSKDFTSLSFIDSLDAFKITIGADDSISTFSKTVSVKPILPSSVGDINQSTDTNYQYANIDVEYLLDDGITSAEGSILHKDWKVGSKDLIIKATNYQPAQDLYFAGISASDYDCQLYFIPGNGSNFIQVKSAVDYDPITGCQFAFENTDAGSFDSNYIYEFRLDILDQSGNKVHEQKINYGFNFAGVQGGG